MPEASLNADPAELEKFSALADDWWNPEGSSRALHALNPVRLAYLRQYADLEGLRILDVGCGGGLLSEAMASAGARVTGLDLAERSLDVARAHAQESGLEIDYRCEPVEALIETDAGSFDMVTCMEMLEHVPQPESVIDACAQLVRPGGMVFFSTLNRTPRAFGLGIVAAEYILGLVPRGTHQYASFIRPSELCRQARASGLESVDVSGMDYDPFRNQAKLGQSVSINYLAAFERVDAP